MIHLVDCGHPPPLLIRHRQLTPLEVRQPEPLLGLGEFTDPGYRVETFPLEAGDLLLLYTDGVIEALDREAPSTRSPSGSHRGRGTAPRRSCDTSAMTCSPTATAAWATTQP